MYAITGIRGQVGSGFVAEGVLRWQKGLQKKGFSFCGRRRGCIATFFAPAIWGKSSEDTVGEIFLNI